MHKGSCLCGAVSFVVNGDLGEASCCHCTQCRKVAGHYEAGVDVARADVTVTGDSNVKWYFSSDSVRRCFCLTCGSPMFFDRMSADRIGLNLGIFDRPTGARIAEHIFVAEKGDYYEIGDGAPQYDTAPDQG